LTTGIFWVAHWVPLGIQTQTIQVAKVTLLTLLHDAVATARCRSPIISIRRCVRGFNKDAIGPSATAGTWMHTTRRERSGVHGCVGRNVGIQTRIRQEGSPVLRSGGRHIRAAATSNKSQAESHGCRDDQLPCCPLQETLNALPDILFLHDPEKMVPLFGCTGCIKKLPGGF
jgi:hypothetical protein